MHTTLTDYLLEIVQNSVEAGARTIRLRWEDGPRALRVVVRDDGCGMSEEQRRRCLDPFYSGGGKHPGRSQGLGLPLLAHLLEDANGSLDIRSVPGRGTRLELRIDPAHIDTPPRGDLADALASAMAFDGTYDLVIERRRTVAAGGAPRGYRLSRRDVIDDLGSVEDWASQVALRRHIEGLEAELEGGSG